MYVNIRQTGAFTRTKDIHAFAGVPGRLVVNIVTTKISFLGGVAVVSKVTFSLKSTCRKCESASKFATFDANRRALETLNPLRDNNEGACWVAAKGRHL